MSLGKEMFPKLKFRIVTDHEKVVKALRFAKYAIEQMPDNAWGVDDETDWCYKYDFISSINEALNIMDRTMPDGTLPD